jgi:hypothetical protein
VLVQFGTYALVVFAAADHLVEQDPGGARSGVTSGSLEGAFNGDLESMALAGRHVVKGSTQSTPRFLTLRSLFLHILVMPAGSA